MISQHQLHGLPAILWEPRASFLVTYFIRPILILATVTDISSEDVREIEGLVGNLTNRRSHLNSKITWFNWREKKNPNKLIKKQKETRNKFHKMKQGYLITKWTHLNPKNNNCREMATRICCKCSFCLAVPICLTWVRSDWFWTIKSDTLHLHQLSCLLEKNELSNKRGCESGLL